MLCCLFDSAKCQQICFNGLQIEYPIVLYTIIIIIITIKIKFKGLSKWVAVTH